MSKSRTIRARLLKSFLLVGLLPSLALSLALFSISYYFLSQQTIRQNEASLKLATHSMERRLDVLSDLFSYLPTINGTSSELSADSLYSLLLEDTGSQLPFSAYKLPIFRRIRSTISGTYLRNNRYINGIYIVTSHDHLYNFSDSYDPQADDVGKYAEWEKKAPQNGIAIIPSGMSGAYPHLTPDMDRRSALTLVKQIPNVVTRQPLAVVIVDLNPSFFEPLQILPTSERSRVVMRSMDGTVWRTIGNGTGSVGLGHSLITEQLPVFGGIEIVFDVAGPLTANIVSSVMLVCGFIALLTILYAVFSSVRSANRLAKPIAHLASEMEVMSDTLPLPVSALGDTQEIRQLYTQYNRMLDAINQHIREKYQHELALSRMQMKAMEAHVDAHFLYNTLECINSMALVNGTQDIARVVKSLSDMFRYISKTPSATVPVRSELRHVQDYITIQRARFGDRVQVEYAIQDEIMDLPILKLCLQPLVENAFKHGFNGMHDTQRIRVIGNRKDGLIRLVVSDNGSGMDPVRLDNVSRALEVGDESGATVGVGLSNIASRLKLHYQGRASLVLRSQKCEGTTVYLLIPEEGEEWTRSSAT